MSKPHGPSSTHHGRSKHSSPATVRPPSPKVEANSHMSSLRKSHDAVVRHGPSNKPPLSSTTTTMMSGGRGTRKSPIPSQLDESHASGGPRHHNNKLGNSMSCGVLDDVKELPKSLDDMDLLSWNDREADSEVESITKNDKREQVKLNAAAQHDLQMIAKQQQLEVGFPHDQEDDDEEIEEGFEGDEGDKGVEVVASLETGSDFSGSEVTAHAAYMTTSSQQQQQQQQQKSTQPSLMNIVDPNMIHALSDEQFQYLQNLLATEERRRRAHAPPSFSTSPPSLGLPKNFHNHSSNKVPTKPSISSLSQSLSSGSSQAQTGGPGSSSRRFTASSSSSFSSSTKPITPTNNNSSGSNSNKSTTVGGVAKKRGSRPGSGSEARRLGEDEDSLFFPLDEDDESQQQHSSSTALGGAVTSLISDFNNFGVSSSIDDTYVLRYGAAPPTEKMWANGSLSGTSPNKPLPTFGHRRPPKNSGVQISKAAAKSSLRKSVTRGEGEEQPAHLVFSSPSQLKTSDRTAFDDISVSSSNSSASRTRKV